ncbi:MAG: histidine--tRNA ligase [Patescibacteria group bacterium]|nr:histidine--tRNA ligase [Patescibacteria group bacterium]MDD5121006.1 histidine--tRNA ligase [Patescibacteria group bacterium]MDD5221633.1 histidine--tRNA ligase [Patescibacteria group bacterium]MDD5396075.1 histidine--tRNA ligase [Patescibacteria group bacterium]
MAKKNKKRGRPTGSRHRAKKYIPHLLKGVKDILPQEQRYYDFIIGKTEELARAYGFDKITIPILEESDLFKRRVGLTKDIFQKEIFSFEDLGGHKISLRPEGTAGVARAYIQHGLSASLQPVKLFYHGPMFRYERLEMGKQKEFYQFGLEIIGSNKPVTDAQLILFVNALLQGLGIKFTIQINNLGCRECRKIYFKKLTDFIRQKGRIFCRECRVKIKRNPLKIFECHGKECHDTLMQAPHIVDYLCEECRSQFVRTLEFLDEARVVYNLNPFVVKGAGFNDRTVFEFWPIKTEQPKPVVANSTISPEITQKIQPQPEEVIDSRLAIAAGGRYDQLLHDLGGAIAPACGLSIGIDRLVDEAKKQQIKTARVKPIQVFVAQVSDLARQNALRIFELIRKEGYRVGENLAQDSLRTQLDIANKLGAKYTLVFGQQEVIHKTVIIRDMVSGSQETIDQEKIVRELRKRL